MINQPQENSLQHIAFIMDGNGRWAKKRGMPREYGHTVGAKVFRRVAEYCFRQGIGTVTIYAFSTENWKRPQKEVNAIMDIFKNYLKMGLSEMTEDNIRIRFLGEKTPFAPDVRATMEKIERKSSANKYNLNVAVNYGGRAELVQAVNRLMQSGVTHVDEAALSNAIDTSGQPDPDLIVRTGGEMRLSNFLMWQSVYSELYFTDVLWPDFTDSDVDAAIAEFHARNRRFGGV
ncbi:MAG: di-trans,poly-cis-decaprenylcistransferase [Clostridia bacterium]|nr:di-trans,poly-cis-decaprenylcistransferase [Clostridia bacterium]